MVVWLYLCKSLLVELLGLGSFFNGNSTLRIDVGISTESMIKLAVVAVVTTLVCVLIAKNLK